MTTNKYTFEQCLNRMKTKKSWYNKSYSGYLFGLAQQGMSIAHGALVSPYAMPYGFFFQNHNRIDHFDWFWDSELLVERRKMLLETAKTDESFAQNFYTNWKVSWDNYLYEWQMLSRVDFNKLSVDAIRDKLVLLHEKYVQCASLSYVVDAFLSDSKEDWLVECIKAELGNRATPEVIEILTMAAYESFVNEFEVKKLGISKLIFENEEDRLVMLKCENLARKFFWIRVNYQSYNRMTAKEIYMEASAEAKKNGHLILDKAQNEKTRVDLNKKKKQHFIKANNISSDLARILEISEIFTHIQDKRKEGVLRTNAIFLSALAIVATKLGLDNKLLFYLWPDEFLSKEKFEKIRWEDIRNRREKGALLLFYNDTGYTFSRDEYKKELPLHNFFVTFTNVLEVRGSVAYKGVISGVARVVHNTGEIENFKDGEILIANQTTPDYVPAMKRAAAFVTDQGGITCHAAIIAREMKKPCVIGTKIATQVFKDGDMVEVDAEKGIVRIV